MERKLSTLVVIFTLLTLFSPSHANANEKLAGMSAAAIYPVTHKVIVDNRAQILKNFLEKSNSPLADHATTFITAADKYNLDWKLVAAIAGLESGYGKAIPTNSYNGWGWGIYGTNVHTFASWDDGIETVSKGLRENYLKNAKEADIYAIGSKYASSPTWAQRVIANMQTIQNFADTTGTLTTETLSLSI